MGFTSYSSFLREKCVQRMRSSAGSARPDRQEFPAIVLAFGVGFSYQLGLDDIDKSGRQRSGEDVSTGASRGSSIGFTSGGNRAREKSIWTTDTLGEDTRGMWLDDRERGSTRCKAVVVDACARDACVDRLVVFLSMVDYKHLIQAIPTVQTTRLFLLEGCGVVP